MIISKKRYLQGFCIVVILLGMVRCIFPKVAQGREDTAFASDATVRNSNSSAAAEAAVVANNRADGARIFVGTSATSKFFKADGSLIKNRIYSVPNFGNAFPDQNDVQLLAANRYGVKPVMDREEAENRKAELVYVGSNPYFYVDRLRSSIPYLVPRAVVLLQDIGRNFFDSLQVKGIPLHKIIVTSVMRSKVDVDKLRGHNGNATQNSCHLYGASPIFRQ